MKSERVLHFISGDLAYKNFLQPLIKFNEHNFLSQNVIIGGTSFDESLKSIKYLDFGYNFKLTSLRVNFFKLFQFISRKSPSIVVSHMSLSSTYPLLISKLLKVEKRIYVCHGAPYLGYGGILRFILKIVEKVNISLSTLTICVSPSIQNELMGISKKLCIFSTDPGSCSGLSYDKYPSKNIVAKSIYEKNLEDKSNKIEEFKKSKIAEDIQKAFPDAELNDLKEEE